MTKPGATAAQAPIRNAARCGWSHHVVDHRAVVAGADRTQLMEGPTIWRPACFGAGRAGRAQTVGKTPVPGPCAVAGHGEPVLCRRTGVRRTYPRRERRTRSGRLDALGPAHRGWIDAAAGVVGGGGAAGSNCGGRWFPTRSGIRREVAAAYAGALSLRDAAAAAALGSRLLVRLGGAGAGAGPLPVASRRPRSWRPNGGRLTEYRCK